MRLEALASATAAVVLLGLGTTAVADPPNFDFNGYASFAAVDGPSTALALASVLTNNGVVPTPIPLDFATHQYTLVAQGILDSVTGISERYGNATIQIYADPIGGGTPADYANLATFTDGTLILGGPFDGFLVRNTFTPTLGNFIGRIDFDSGTLLGQLPTTDNWPFAGGWSRTVSGIPAGSVENWDGLIDMGQVGAASRAWGAVKNLYR